MSTSVTYPALAPPLLAYEANITSQTGEDGVIARALELIGDRDRWCVEFGAWDGRQASNTYSLIERERYSAVLIEADPARFEALTATHAHRPGVTALRRRVSFEGADRLDAILAPTPLPREFDLLSIDIDGNDFHVWQALENYRPKLVVVEYNPTIPNEIDFVQPRDLRVQQGCSLSALARLGESKGYRLIHATVVNGLFVDERYFPAFGIEDASPTALRADLSHVTWMFQTYDGQLHFAGNRRLRWHDLPIADRRLQLVPRWLRRFPPSFTPLQRSGWRAWQAVNDPRGLAARIARRRQLR